MKPIGSFLAQLAKDFQNQPIVVEVIIKGQWKSLVGDRISNNSLPVSFDEGTLLVQVSDERWLAELNNLSDEIRRRLNGFFEKEIVTRIQFVQKT
ncbi:MAG TPA: DUF721 domain-containing protein [Acidobacteriota bacterium]|jgi:hypothetical protein